MSSAQRVVVLTILKIFNWNESKSSNLFEVAFSSLKTSAPILSKQLKGKVGPAEVTFNYSLRVAYTPDENEIVVKLSHFQQSKNALNLLTEFSLNLDHLASKKVQFFPFGKNDKVLKITLGEQNQGALPQRQPPHRQPPSRTNQQFIRQKEEFLRRIGTASSSSRPNQENSSRKSFSIQTKDLLAEIRTMRNGKPDLHGGVQQNFHDYQIYQSGARGRPGLGRFNQQIISKSSSYQSLGMVSLQPSLGRDGDSSRQSNHSQKHKLKVKNLEMVVCDNEYYDDYCEPKPERKSDMLASKAFQSKKRIIRSELY